MTTLCFLGASQQVTGSCYLIESLNQRLLLECGMYQGELRPEKSPDQVFSFDPQDIDGVVLSHAHLDHSGMLPRLVKEGYRGPIFTTFATQDLLEIMLKDAAHLQEKDVEWENKRRLRKGREPIEPFYSLADVEQVMAQIVPAKYDQSVQPLPGIKLYRFRHC